MSGSTPELGRCLLCGRPSQHRHHYTARATFDGPYLDGGSTIPVCSHCHYSEHAVWRDCGLDVVAGLHTELVARVRRTTWTLGRIADRRCAVTFDAATLRGLHDVLVAVQGDMLALTGEAER